MRNGRVPRFSTTRWTRTFSPRKNAGLSSSSESLTPIGTGSFASGPAAARSTRQAATAAALRGLRMTIPPASGAGPPLTDEGPGGKVWGGPSPATLLLFLGQGVQRPGGRPVGAAVEHRAHTGHGLASPAGLQQDPPEEQRRAV